MPGLLITQIWYPKLDLSSVYGTVNSLTYCEQGNTIIVHVHVHAYHNHQNHWLITTSYYSQIPNFQNAMKI